MGDLEFSIVLGGLHACPRLIKEWALLKAVLGTSMGILHMPILVGLSSGMILEKEPSILWPKDFSARPLAVLYSKK